MTFYHRYKNHILIWVCYILYVYLLEIWNDPNEKFLDILFANTSSISTFYLSLFAYRLIDRKKWILGCSCIIFSFICCWIVRYIYWHFLLALIDVKPYKPYEFEMFTRIVIRVFIIFSLYSLGYFFAQRSIQKQKQLRLLEQQKAEIEKEKLKIEKAKLQIENENLRLQDDFLRAQINPHFLYNCLNFFYTQTYQTHTNVAEGVMMLSDIMRYSLKDYSTTNGLANLSEEITHIENVINIHQLRFGGALQINFKVEGAVEGKLVSPMVLITLVENIFKHGDLQDKNNVALVYCSIDNARQIIYFSTHNKKKTGTYEGSTGIGLNNIKQRLQSLYKDNFRMDTTDEATMYKKEITLPFFDQSH